VSNFFNILDQGAAGNLETIVIFPVIGTVITSTGVSFVPSFTDRYILNIEGSAFATATGFRVITIELRQGSVVGSLIGSAPLELIFNNTGVNHILGRGLLISNLIAGTSYFLIAVLGASITTDENNRWSGIITNV